VQCAKVPSDADKLQNIQTSGWAGEVKANCRLVLYVGVDCLQSVQVPVSVRSTAFQQRHRTRTK